MCDKPGNIFDLGEQVVNMVCINWQNGSNKVSSVQDVDRSPGCVVKGQVVRQPPTEWVTPWEVASCEVPMGDGCPPVCVPSADTALTNPGKIVDDICNIERCNVGMNMSVHVKPSNVLMIHDDVGYKRYM